MQDAFLRGFLEEYTRYNAYADAPTLHGSDNHHPDIDT